MISKYRVQKLVKIHMPRYVKDLDLKKWQLNVHIYKSGARKLKEIGVDSQHRQGHYGISYIESNYCADIILFYDQFHSESTALKTLFHELIHIFLWPLTKNQPRLNKTEEKLVRILEKFYYNVL